MRRYARSLIFIGIIMVLSVLALGFQHINIGGFERGSDSVLGLELGLDLRGGSHLVYQAQFPEDEDPTAASSAAINSDRMESLKRTIERRVNASGLGEPIIQILGSDRLLIQLPGVSDLDRAKELIGETAVLEFKHRRFNVATPVSDITTDDILAVTVEMLKPDGTLVSDAVAEEPESSEAVAPAEGESAEQSGEATTETVGEQSESPQTVTPAAGESAEQTGEGAAEAEAAQTPEEDVQPDEVDASPVIVVEFTEEGIEKFAVVADRVLESLIQATSGRTQPTRLEVSLEGDQLLRFELLGTSLLRLGDSNRYAFPFPTNTPAGVIEDEETARSFVGDNATVSFTEVGTIDEDFGLTGDDLSRAYPSQHATSGVPIVNLEFGSRGTKIFGDKTSEIAGLIDTDAIAIFLDGEELIAPVVNTPITAGTAIIQGNFTITRARDISLLLESGRLPIPITLIQERDVDAILGADSLRRSLIAGVVGLALILAFMIAYYRLPGVIASLALIMYSVMVLAIFKILPVTLTLSGISAVILSIGIAVDANILIFERMKDELRAGRTLSSAINIGFNRAWPAIRDGNVSTLITAGVLFWFADQLGATIVQGFAVTLAIGVGMSMFTAIVISRTFLRVLATTRVARNYNMFVPAGGIEEPLQSSSRPATQRS